LWPFYFIPQETTTHDHGPKKASAMALEETHMLSRWPPAYGGDLPKTAEFTDLADPTQPILIPIPIPISHFPFSIFNFQFSIAPAPYSSTTMRKPTSMTGW
jgi:hypothetical protein